MREIKSDVSYVLRLSLLQLCSPSLSPATFPRSSLFVGSPSCSGLPGLPTVRVNCLSFHGVSLASLTFAMQTGSLVTKNPRPQTSTLTSRECSTFSRTILAGFWVILFFCLFDSENPCHTDCPQSLLHIHVSLQGWKYHCPQWEVKYESQGQDALLNFGDFLLFKD